MADNTIRFSNIIKYLSVGVFLISIACPCFDTEKEPGDHWEGMAILLSGFFGFFSSLTGLVWLANPALWFSWGFVIKKPNVSLILSLIAVAIGFSFLLCTDIMTDEGSSNFSLITRYRTGYWLWIASMLTMLLGNLYLKFSNTNSMDRSF